MRETKFRGKRVDNSEWVEGCLIKGLFFTRERREDIPYIMSADAIEYDCFDDFTEDNGIYRIIPETVGQYIQTVNNHDIFTKDIVKAYKHGDLESKPFIREITERVGTYWFGNWTWIEFLNIFRYVEVIGNSTDNPELLEVSNG